MNTFCIINLNSNDKDNASIIIMCFIAFFLLVYCYGKKNVRLFIIGIINHIKCVVISSMV